MTSRFRALRKLLGGLAYHQPRKTALAAALLVLQGLTEGIGLVLLVPFLILVGDRGGAAGRGGVVSFVERGFDAVGMPLGLRSVLVAFVVLVALRSWLLAKSGVLLAAIQLGFLNRLRARIFGAMGRAGWRYLVRRRLADLVHAMTQDVGRVGIGTRDTLDLVATAVLAAFYGLAAVRISPATTAIALLIGVLLEAIRWPLIRKARQMGEAMTEVQQRAFAVVTDFTGGLKAIKARGLEERHRAAYLDAMEGLEAQRLEYNRLALRAHAVHQVALSLALAGLVLVASTKMGVPTEELLVVVFIFARLMPLFSRMHRAYASMMEALPAFEASTRMCRELEAHAEAPGPRDATPLTLGRALALEDVTVRYEDADGPALDGVSFTLGARRTLGVIGPSGAGKTTLADVLMGLLSPDGGRVTVDGEPLVGPRLHAWRRSVGYVPQETFLLHDTIAANLRWMAPEASDDELWEALGRAAAERFVRRLPQGLATVVGDRGTRLSGGERQRIALARALLARPQLLVLDEATSQLDAENERRILDALDKLHGEVTIVVVAHRPTLLSRADDVLCLDEGRVVEAGPREALLRDGGGRLAAWLAEHGQAEASRPAG